MWIKLLVMLKTGAILLLFFFLPVNFTKFILPRGKDMLQ